MAHEWGARWRGVQQVPVKPPLDLRIIVKPPTNDKRWVKRTQWSVHASPSVNDAVPTTARAAIAA